MKPINDIFLHIFLLLQQTEQRIFLKYAPDIFKILLFYILSQQTKKQKKEDKFVEGVYKFLGENLFRKVMRLFLRIRVKKYTKIYKKRFPLLMKKEENK